MNDEKETYEQYLIRKGFTSPHQAMIDLALEASKLITTSLKLAEKYKAEMKESIENQ